jgi:GT2 family glycosyltransferase
VCCRRSKRWFEGRHLSRPVYFAFVTGPHTTTAEYLDRVAASNPDSSLLVVARSRPARGEWLEIRRGQGTGSIIAACLRAAADREIQGAAVHATRASGEWRMRLAALRLGGRDLRLYNDNLDHFRFGDMRTLGQHLKWRWKQRQRGVLWWRSLARLAISCGREHRHPWKIGGPERRFAATPVVPGISLVVPTRDGRELLDTMLPPVVEDLRAQAAEIIVVDNGSSDGTTAFLREQYPEIRIEQSPTPLSFSEAVNRGIGAARFSHVVLLNNDMQVEPGFFGALQAAFDRTPELFCATAQIFFPTGQRREETGLCFWRCDGGDDFPVYCAEPRGDEDGARVLYGSGGCSMYDTLKLRELGGFDEVYRPAYVEDLDIGYRAWQRGWPTIFCAGARVEHRHRATTSRYYSPEYLDYLVERNYLRFLVRATGDIFPELWSAAIRRLQDRASTGDRAARRALRMAWREGLARGVRRSSIDERALKQSLTK